MYSEIILFLILLLPFTVLLPPSRQHVIVPSHVAFRGFLALMIVAGHDINVFFNPETLRWDFPYPEWISALRMGVQTTGFLIVAIFFAFSAYGCREKWLASDTYRGDFLTQRLKKIYIPFLVVNLSCGLLWMGLFREISVKQIILSCFDVSIMPLLWYVPHALVFYVVFFCLYSNIKKSDLWICIVYALFILYNFFAVKNETFYVSEGGVIIGILYSKYEERISHWKARTWVILLICFFLVYNYPFLFWPNGIRWSVLDNGPIYRISSSMLAALLGIFITKRIDFSKSIFLAFLGRISYEIYLTHGFVGVWTDKCIALLEGKGLSSGASWGIKNALTIILTVFLSVEFHRAFQLIFGKLRTIEKRSYRI